MRGISKRFGPVLANDQIDLALSPGEIHAVLGENGAGKTTLMNILSGMYQPDSGEILLGNSPVSIASPAQALNLGIGTVYQHFTLVPNLSVIENVILGADTGFRLDLESSQQRLKTMLTDFDLTVSPDTEIRHLSIGQRQRVEIIKVLFRGSRVLLLDEPTSVLTPVEVSGLFAILRRLREQGVAVVIITHKLDEALEISDCITILRQGRKVGEIRTETLLQENKETSRSRIVEMMFGGIPVDIAQDQVVQTAEQTLLALIDVSAQGDRGSSAIDRLNLELRAGEVFGIAGVDGNGQKELGEVIAGQRRSTAGQIVVDGVDVTNKGVFVASRAGVGYVTDDRLGEGSVPGSSVAENAVLKTVARGPFSRRLWLDRKAIDMHARELIEQFDIRTPSTQTRMTLLSGGNIQKLLLARELAMRPKVLVCNKPTYGLDQKTAQFVQRTLRQTADRGNTVLLISSELDELLDISDRIGVMFNGELVAIFPRGAFNVETIGQLMLSGQQESLAGAVQ